MSNRVGGDFAHADRRAWLPTYTDLAMSLRPKIKTPEKASSGALDLISAAGFERGFRSSRLFRWTPELRTLPAGLR
jgi:hypothetical protein